MNESQSHRNIRVIRREFSILLTLHRRDWP